MRNIVTGDRNWYATDLAKEVLNRLILRYGPCLVIVHGGATGIDRSFAEACGEVGIEQEAHPARWEELDHPDAAIRYDNRNRPYNANAGPIRNAEMVAAGADMYVAFHRAISASKGTKDCVRRALAAGITTYLVSSDDAEPRRLRAGDGRLRRPPASGSRPRSIEASGDFLTTDLTTGVSGPSGSPDFPSYRAWRR